MLWVGIGQAVVTLAGSFVGDTLTTFSDVIEVISDGCFEYEVKVGSIDCFLRLVGGITSRCLYLLIRVGSNGSFQASVEVGSTKWSLDLVRVGFERCLHHLVRVGSDSL